MLTLSCLLWLSSILPTQTFVSVDVWTFGKQAATFHQHCDWVIETFSEIPHTESSEVDTLKTKYCLLVVSRRVHWVQVVGKSVRVWLSQGEGGKQHCLLLCCCSRVEDCCLTWEKSVGCQKSCEWDLLGHSKSEPNIQSYRQPIQAGYFLSDGKINPHIDSLWETHHKCR